ncbi:MAG TPA: class I SAM-dependent methyltransferase [Candidatus Dormibacteraeota bacterium]|nr:class I SAM-dependent methyltransferase [Candidatus Dormibacteraeota bacterium]
MEVRLLERHASFRGRRILEIGSGDGRLTREFAQVASSVVAIEPDPVAVKLARKLTAAEGIQNVSFRVGSAERARLGTGRFDVVLFSWAL